MLDLVKSGVGLSLARDAIAIARSACARADHRRRHDGADRSCSFVALRKDEPAIAAALSRSSNRTMDCATERLDRATDMSRSHDRLSHVAASSCAARRPSRSSARHARTKHAQVLLDRFALTRQPHSFSVRLTSSQEFLRTWHATLKSKPARSISTQLRERAAAARARRAADLPPAGLLLRRAARPPEAAPVRRRHAGRADLLPARRPRRPESVVLHAQPRDESRSDARAARARADDARHRHEGASCVSRRAHADSSGPRGRSRRFRRTRSRARARTTTKKAAQAEAHAMFASLGVPEADLVAVAYVDLLSPEARRSKRMMTLRGRGAAITLLSRAAPATDGRAAAARCA